MKITFFGLVLGALLFSGAPLHAEPAFLGNPHFQAQTLDAESVKAILMGKRVTLGSARIVIIIAKTSPAQDAFLHSHLGMTTSQLQNHWRRLFMTGGGSAPKIVETESDACKLALETPGAVLIADTEHMVGLTIFAGK